ncbi:helix-turn-helix domain-containing protein [Bradyrhizobium erythrophlei]|uniref:helix-turn-helix domain-containing protein n=1 Tax=Bradyrhizobium erythrophlei TaxID=1437360 RepID=UPI0015C52FE0|nr:helix-turn-helix domain-containing protein [Bradyrhizobium erythrophlei]
MRRLSDAFAEGLRLRIYPNVVQEDLFRQTIDCCRLVYNLCLNQKIPWRELSRPLKLTAYDQMKELTALKEQFEFLYGVPSRMSRSRFVCTQLRRALRRARGEEHPRARSKPDQRTSEDGLRA